MTRNVGAPYRPIGAVLSGVVSSWNEWDPLEEIIVGILDGASGEEWSFAREATIPRDRVDEVRRRMMSNAGKPRLKTDPERVAAAQKDLDEFVHILEAEGVTVRRPDPVDHSRPYQTPDWICTGGRSSTVPRDVMIVVGDEILESTMCWRSRYFEILGYRSLIKEYFRGGARWSAAPKPRMLDELYKKDFVLGEGYVLTEAEPVFDAADICRIGKDLFVQKSNVTNDLGIQWLQRHFDGRLNVHAVEFDDPRAWHIDATFVPLAPGKLLLNPDRPIKQLPEMFRRAGWEILECPLTSISTSDVDYELQKWLHMNMLSLDEKRIIVEKNEERLIRTLTEWGFQPIPCSFRAFYKFGGSFHCATCDVRRRGQLQSYF